MLNCVFTFFVFTSWAVDQHRHFLNTGSTVQGQPYILWPCQSGKTWKKIFAYPALTCFCHVWDRHGEWWLLSWVRVCCTVSGSGGESCKPGGKRSHICMITFSCILLFSLTQGRAMRKIKFYFILEWSQMLASTLAAGVRNWTTDTVT